MRTSTTLIVLALALVMGAQGISAACKVGGGTGCAKCSGTGAKAVCTGCQLGFDLNASKKCVKLTPGCAQGDYRTPNKCTRCIPTYYLGPVGQCLRCGNACVACVANGKCTKCVLPYVAAGGKCTLSVQQILNSGVPLAEIVKSLPIDTESGLPLGLIDLLGQKGAVGQLLKTLGLGGASTGAAPNSGVLGSLLGSLGINLGGTPGTSTGTGGLLGGLLGGTSGGLLGGSTGGLLG